ncbi:LysR family transcriptional regulator [Achromobacter xylosoxidans]
MNQSLDIDLLRTFHAVARLGQFRAAAEHVHRSPAAVSVHIQRLEAVVGGRLLERDNQSVTLTPLGQRVLGGTAELLRVHDRVLGGIQGRRLPGVSSWACPTSTRPTSSATSCRCSPRTGRASCWK